MARIYRYDLQEIISETSHTCASFKDTSFDALSEDNKNQGKTKTLKFSRSMRRTWPNKKNYDTKVGPLTRSVKLFYLLGYLELAFLKCFFF